MLPKADQADRDEAWNDAEITEAVGVAPETVFNVQRRWVQGGLEAAPNRKKQERPSRTRETSRRGGGKTCGSLLLPSSRRAR